MLSVVMLSAGILWADSDNTFNAEVGLFLWNPSFTANPAFSDTFSSSLLIGPKANVIYEGFFADIKYLIPISGFDATEGLTQYSEKLSWLNISMGYMVTQNIGIYVDYLYHSVTIKETILNITLPENTISISGPGAGFVVYLPIIKIGNIYANGSYNFGTINEGAQAGSYTCKAIDIEGGLGITLKAEHLTLGWKYHEDFFTDSNGSTIWIFSGPFASFTYNFGY